MNIDQLVEDQAASLTDTVTDITPWFFGKADEPIVYRCTLMSMREVEKQTRRQCQQEIADLIAERDGWQETARHYAQGQEFYHDIVRQAGEHFGIEARTSDDGSVQDDVIALKVPELVGDMVKDNSNRGQA